MNIPACFLGSGQKNKRETYDNMLEGVYRVVYVTPEFTEGKHNVFVIIIIVYYAFV